MSYSYSYKNSSSGGGAPRSGMPVSSLGMDADMMRMKREMEMGMNPSTGSNSSYSYKTSSSTGGGLAPATSIHVQRDPLSSSGDTTSKRVLTTTTTKTNPAAQREFENLERDFSRIGRTPDNYHDDFDKIKREVLTGEAYRGDTTTQVPVSMKLREEHVRGAPSGGLSETTTTTTKRSYGSGVPSEQTVTTTTRTGGSGGCIDRRPEHSEVFIPVKTYDSTFDDIHMNRWMDHRDHFGTIPSSDLDMHRLDWQNRLGGVRTGMFKFSPHNDFGGASNNIESSRTVAKNPLGKPEFSVQFDMRDFKPEDISLTTKHGKLIISATHEEKIGSSTSRREFTRSVDLPADIQVNLMRSVFSRDGVLSITAPIKPPHYDSSSMLQQTGQYGHSFASQPAFSPPSPYKTNFDYPPTATTNEQTQHEKKTYVSTLNSSQAPVTSVYPSPSRSPPLTPPKSRYGSIASPASSVGSQVANTDTFQKALDYTLPTAGFSPEDFTVTVEGRKVKIRGRHVEVRVGGRKTHNEFTKVFDLPSTVAPETVKCYIQDGHTLHIVSDIRDDIQGAVHFIPVTRKW